MGNASSSGDKFAKVIDAQGKPRKVKLPAKAAEIMLEEPGHIICGVEELKRARRVVAMRADDELLGCKVYVLVPIGRIHCRVTDADMVIIKAACCGRKKMRGAKVLPDVMVSEEEKYTNEIPTVSGHRFGNCRPWMPVLEPIPEVLC
ncbi:Secretion-associated RAS super family 2 isoform 1 [Hibiscus syriacus]|uniref:Secretion-associated RAS super family 2 isoform 1 n=1 Tax=Hibiscus syriacus TaxID=106335 RepID=A0A6A2YRC7_HIBSY|nr:Secretion-associated RAS super family 2 isoform 1 [Hibiscus syriacus]